MKLNEFKAWFDGFTESLDGPPSKKQWERIKEQVAAIDGTPVSYPVYIDRYLRPYHRWYDSVTWGLSDVPQNLRAYSISAKSDGGTVLNQSSLRLSDIEENFDSLTAMYAAGKAEAAVNEWGV